MWTQFMDMHSGGGCKEEPYEHIYIEAPESEARVIFYNRFGHNPDRVSCTCCGEDYSLTESETLEKATAFNRGCDYVYVDPDGKECTQDDAFAPRKGLRDGYRAGYTERPSKKMFLCTTYQTLAEYLKSKSVLVIRSGDIKDSERRGTVPRQGYVWQE